MWVVVAPTLPTNTWDMADKWAVRIILECFLVNILGSESFHKVLLAGTRAKFFYTSIFSECKKFKTNLITAGRVSRLHPLLGPVQLHSRHDKVPCIGPCHFPKLGERGAGRGEAKATTKLTLCEPAINLGRLFFQFFHNCDLIEIKQVVSRYTCCTWICGKKQPKWTDMYLLLQRFQVWDNYEALSPMFHS